MDRTSSAADGLGWAEARILGRVPPRSSSFLDLGKRDPCPGFNSGNPS